MFMDENFENVNLFGMICSSWITTTKCHWPMGNDDFIATASLGPSHIGLERQLYLFAKTNDSLQVCSLNELSLEKALKFSALLGGILNLGE